ncbi:NlpC/P60 family protein [Tenacibaculum sp.]|nr:NlpC/P60 family protein [Tenacibaculum sp.]
MKKYIVLNLFLLCCAFSINAQVIFESVVLEEDTSAAVEGVIVKIEETEFATRTDADGKFSFNGKLPEGEYLVSVSGDLYKLKVFSVVYQKGRKIKLEEVRIEVTKKEAKKRKKAKKDHEKMIAKKIKDIEKEEKRKAKFLKKKKKELSKENTVEVEYGEVDENAESSEISESQKKYAKILEVDVLKLSNRDLYEFIDKWEGTPYKMGASSKDAIDCSAFTQRLLIKAKDMLIERTAQKQFDSEYTDKFKGTEYLQEGDLLFFGKDKANIVHVGMYLHNNRFIHATSRKVDGPSGVKISDITHPYWAKLLVSAGRRVNNE